MTTNTFRNYIAGDWVAGATAIANRNPSDLNDVIGEYAQADDFDREWLCLIANGSPGAERCVLQRCKT